MVLLNTRVFVTGGHAMENNINIFEEFLSLSISDLEQLLNQAKNRQESLFYQRMLSLKMGLAQEEIVGEELL